MTNIFSTRRENLRKKIHAQGMDAYLVLHPANRFYLSGFELHDPQCNESAGALLITSSGRDWLFTDPRYHEAAKQVWPEADIFIHRNKRIPALTEFLGSLKPGNLGFESRIMSHELFSALQDTLTLTPHQGLVEELRVIKDQDEIERMSESCALNHQVFSHIQSLLQPGWTEEDLAWEVERWFREHGASELAFPPILAVDEDAALPHFIPGKKSLTQDSLLLMDVGARYKGYCSDQTRTLWSGPKPSTRFQKNLDLVQQAQHQAIAALRPGMAIKDLYEVAWKSFDRHQVAEHFTHALGHGIGLETHEYPGLGPKTEGVLQPGMVVTIEPGLYYPEWGGIRWEHMVLVADQGAQVL